MKLSLSFKGQFLFAHLLALLLGMSSCSTDSISTSIGSIGEEEEVSTATQEVFYEAHGLSGNVYTELSKYSDIDYIFEEHMIVDVQEVEFSTSYVNGNMTITENGLGDSFYAIVKRDDISSFLGYNIATNYIPIHSENYHLLY